MTLPSLRINKLNFTQAGFTMIELLVVIAVIGVLAVAVLSSINPIEQINKGRDTRTRSDAAQLLNSFDRFFAISELYPWNDATYGGGTGSADTLYTTVFPDGAICVASTAPAGFCLLDSSQVGAGTWGAALTSTEELKQGILNRVGSNGDSATLNGALYLSKAASGAGVDDSPYICFLPTSNAFQQEALDRCVEDKGSGGPDDLPAGACPQATYDATTTFLDEYICLP